MIDMQDMKPTNGVKIIKATKPAKAKTTAAANDQEKEILRVAAYCRVSTDSDEQENSYEAQCSYYRRYISSNPKWELAGIFADEGITGTMVRNRKQFQAMIRACEDGKIDMIITKSLSRFSRNTVDCLLTVRRLKELGIPVIFEKEGFNTEVTSGEMMLTFMSSFAQQESESISENVKLGLQMNAKAGKGQLNITHFLGYDRGDEPHSMVINPEQADVVRRIYREFLDGYPITRIASRLQSECVPTATGKGHWYNTTIRSILTNEKYCGDLLLQKYYTPDFLTHRVRRNIGQLPQYYIPDHHDAIIPKPLFWQVQWELRRRSGENMIPYRNENTLGGRVLCGKCGKSLQRFLRKKPEHTYWRCRQRSSSGISYLDPVEKCSCRSVDDEELKSAIISTLNSLRDRYEALIRMHESLQNGELKRIDSFLAFEEERLQKLKQEKDSPACYSSFIQTQIDEIEEHKNELYIERASSANQEMQVRMLLELVRQMFSKANEHWKRLLEKDLYDGSAYTEPEDFFNRTAYQLPSDLLNANGCIAKYDETLALRYIENITVLDDGYEVRLKAGITMTV